MEIYTIGVDLGKNAVSFGRCRFGGTVVVRIRCCRAQLLAYTANIASASRGGQWHFLGRALREQGHDVRLLPAQYVKPFHRLPCSRRSSPSRVRFSAQKPRALACCGPF
jgi:transposase